jgi:NCAIR mutase (PurE)-related protein
MEPAELNHLASELLRGGISVEDFVRRLARAPIADTGDAQLDLDRRRRCGFPEVIFGERKSLESLERIFTALRAEQIDVFATRIPAEFADALLRKFPTARYSPLGRTFRIPLEQAPADEEADRGRVAIVTAGTSDLPVAEEARETALWMGVDVRFVQDVGVAGPHRLPARLPQILGSDAVVVIAGMEGALPSVVGGYVDCPVIGVPTSVGYGVADGGRTALNAMLASCAAGLAVVGIDDGFGAGTIATRIAVRSAAGGASGRISA